jgi:hypothetical protein
MSAAGIGAMIQLNIAKRMIRELVKAFLERAEEGYTNSDGKYIDGLAPSETELIQKARDFTRPKAPKKKKARQHAHTQRCYARGCKYIHEDDIV